LRMRALDFAAKTYLAAVAFGYVALCTSLIGLALR
jgi:hypothetical protein